MNSHFDLEIPRRFGMPLTGFCACRKCSYLFEHFWVTGEARFAASDRSGQVGLPRLDLQV